MSFENKIKILSVEKAINIINYIAETGGSVSLTDIASALSYPKSTTHGILSTLREYAFIEQLESNGKYKLGIRLFELGAIISKSWDVSNVAKPFIRQIMLKYKLSTQLATISDNNVVFIESENPTSQLRVIADAGNTMPVHSNAFGKAILAYKSESVVNKIIKHTKMVPFTSHTIVTGEQYKKELERVYGNGYAIDNGETRIGMRCIAVPIFDVHNDVEYAIGVTGLFCKIEDSFFVEVRNALIKASEEISQLIGNKK